MRAVKAKRIRRMIQEAYPYGTDRPFKEGHKRINPRRQAKKVLLAKQRA